MINPVDSFVMNCMMLFLTLFLASFTCLIIMIIRDGLDDWKRKKAAKQIKPKTPAPRNDHV